LNQLLEEAAAELSKDFSDSTVRERLEFLLEFSDNLPALPSRYAEHPDLLERVEECQSPVYLFVEVDGSKVRTFFSAPEESPTTRGFAGILSSLLDGRSINEVLTFSDDYPDSLGLAEAVSPLRLRGMRAMLFRLKRQVLEKQSGSSH
jgi:cysteine desulfuration protein SufE